MNRNWIVPLALMATMGAIIPASALGKGESRGLQVGASLGPFQTIKCAGAKNDGVEVGEHVCYRSRFSSRSQIIIFTKHAEKIETILKAIDSRLEGNDSLRAFVNVLGDNLESTQKKAAEFGEKLSIKHIAIVVPVEHQFGPEQYQLNTDAIATVILARRSRVAGNHTLLKDEEIKAFTDTILAELDKL